LNSFLNTQLNEEEDEEVVDNLKDLSCNVCGLVEDFDGDDTVFCDDREVAVHQQCFGVCSIPPEGKPRYCLDCSLGEPLDATCVLRGESGGALKPLAPPVNSSNSPTKQSQYVCTSALRTVDPGDLHPGGGLCGAKQRNGAQKTGRTEMLNM
jgi:hypothetical protein